MRAVANFSGGLGSWAASKLAAVEYGPANLTLLFADTLVEDADLYRFLIDGACNVFGLPTPAALTGMADKLPAVNEDTMPARKVALAELRVTATTYLGGRLVWLADGRTPWEVFRDERFLGNSRADPCSKILKRELLDRWFEANCERPTTRCVVGLGLWERARFDGNGEKLGLRRRMAAKGWTFVAPLIDHRPVIDRPDLPRMAEAEGLDPSRAYDDGFGHDNCAGVCVKGGQAHWRKMYLRRRPEFDYAERQENGLRNLLGDVSMMADRKGGKKIPLPLSEFRKRLEAGQTGELFGGEPCGCFTGEDT